MTTMISRSRSTSSGRALLVASAFGLSVGILGGACFLAGPLLVQLVDGVHVPTRFLVGLLCGLAIPLVAPRLVRIFKQRSPEPLPVARLIRR